MPEEQTLEERFDDYLFYSQLEIGARGSLASNLLTPEELQAHQARKARYDQILDKLAQAPDLADHIIQQGLLSVGKMSELQSRTQGTLDESLVANAVDKLRTAIAFIERHGKGNEESESLLEKARAEAWRFKALGFMSLNIPE